MCALWCVLVCMQACACVALCALVLDDPCLHALACACVCVRPAVCLCVCLSVCASACLACLLRLRYATAYHYTLKVITDVFLSYLYNLYLWGVRRNFTLGACALAGSYGHNIFYLFLE